jgi:hypothetical protein
MNDNLKLVNTPEDKFYCLDPKTSNLLENLRDLASAYPGIDDKMIHPGMFALILVPILALFQL